jgi:hypothetical protein
MGGDRGWLPFIDMLAVLPRQNRVRWAASYHRRKPFGTQVAPFQCTVGGDPTEVKCGVADSCQNARAAVRSGANAEMAPISLAFRLGMMGAARYARMGPQFPEGTR